LAGGSLAPYLTNSRERRASRAAAAESLDGVESARWAGARGVTVLELRAAIAAFEAKALVAGVPWRVVELCTRLALVSRATSERVVEQNADSYDDPSEAGGINAEVASLVIRARALIIRAAWRPWQSRWRQQANVAAIYKDVEVLRAEDTWINWWPWTTT